MSDELGIFSDGGLLEGDFYSVTEAEAAIADRYGEEDGCYVASVCPEHRDQEKGHCETCDQDDSEDEVSDG
jgi:hypothetical protein